jgi:hypothetical protein
MNNRRGEDRAEDDFIAENDRHQVAVLQKIEHESIPQGEEKWFGSR